MPGKVKPPQPTHQPVTGMTDEDKIGLQHVLESIARTQDRRAQVLLFFGTSNLAVVGFSLQQQKAGLLIIAILLALLMLIAEAINRVELGTLYYMAYFIERKYSQTGGLIYTYLTIAEPHLKLIAMFEQFNSISDEQVRGKKLQRLFSSLSGPKRGPSLFGVAIVVLELFFVGYFYWILGWSLF